MAKTKTKKYFIESTLGDSIISCNMEVSKSKFEEQLKKTLTQVENQDAVEGDEFYIEQHVRDYDKETFTEHQIEVTWGCSSIYFIELTCKAGYCFKK